MPIHSFCDSLYTKTCLSIYDIIIAFNIATDIAFVCFILHTDVYIYLVFCTDQFEIPVPPQYPPGILLLVIEIPILQGRNGPSSNVPP